MDLFTSLFTLKRISLSSHRRQLAALLLGALGAVVIVACADSTDQQPQIEPTATFSPADATATWEAFKPELDRMAAEVLEQQIIQATAAAATPTPGANTPAASPEVDPAPNPVPSTPPPRAIATGPVDRIAISDGHGSIHTVNPDGSGLATVADGSTTGGVIRYTFPVWSPD